jgi:hypothetical protein
MGKSEPLTSHFSGNVSRTSFTNGSALIQIRSQLFQVLLHHPVKDSGEKKIVVVRVEIDVLIYLIDLRTSSDHVKMHIPSHENALPIT